MMVQRKFLNGLENEGTGGGRTTGKRWSGKRDSNSRLQPWQGCTLPLSYSRSWVPVRMWFLAEGTGEVKFLNCARCRNLSVMMKMFGEKGKACTNLFSG